MTIKDLNCELLNRYPVGNGYRCTYKVTDDIKLLRGQVVLDEDVNRQFTVPYDFELISGQELSVNFH